MRAQLIYSADCPNADAARANLRRALASCAFMDGFEEIDTLNPDTPMHLREWGSPTILIDGEDVGGSAGPAGPSCRLYHGLYRVPSEEAIRAAVDRALHRSGR